MRKIFLGIIALMTLMNFSVIELGTIYSDPNGEEYLAFAEKMPEPIGGLPAIYKNVVYPKVALQAGVQGKVFLLAFIDETGSVGDVKVLKGIGAGCDEAAIDAVKATKFNPGENKGNPVKVKFSVAIVFKAN